jgi:hypothetical protein
MADQEPREKPKSDEKPSAKPARGDAKKASKPRVGKRQAREAEVQAALVLDLDHLRSVAREIASHFMERLESEIVQIRETVLASSASAKRLRHLSTIQRALQGLTVKPQKGRRKDLKRIDELVVLLNRIVQKM